MEPEQYPQVEKLVDQALKHSKFQDLEEFLLDESREGLFFKCSRLFLSKLDHLVNRELDHRNMKHASVVFTILHKLGDMLVFPGGEGISVLVSQGLVTKWFEKLRQFWIETGPVKNEILINLAEDFFDVLMVVHQSCKEGTYQVTESLLHHIGKLASDAQVNILIQKEAVKKLNVILGKIPVELKKEKKILASQEASTMMNDLAGQILKGGDYDLQVALMEALCRMTSRAQRRELANRWFSMAFVASAFIRIQDSKFETDCRTFLNLVNGMQGDGRSVFSYPCLEVFLDKHLLLMPVDENLKEFWIDFNLGSQSISFYFCLAGDEAQEGQWETLCIAENEVHSYTVEVENDVKVLQLVLTEPLCLSNFKGSKLIIHFSPSLDILQVTKKVYGETKNKKFVGKTTTSVVKTTVQIILDDEGSQVVFTESQGSSQPKERAVPRSSKSNTSCHSSVCHERDAQHLNQQTKTPLRSKVSESCLYVSGSTGRQLGISPFSSVMPASTPAGKAKVKPALKMVSSSERKKETELRELLIARPSHSMPSVIKDQEHVKNKAIPAVQNVDIQQNLKNCKEVERYRRHIPVAKVLEMVQANHEEEPLDTSIAPDSQPAVRKETSMFPGLLDIVNKKISVSGSLLPCQSNLSKHQYTSKLSAPVTLDTELPQRPSSAQHTSAGLSHKQLHAQLTHRLEQVLREREQQVEPCTSAQRRVSSVGKHLQQPASAAKGSGTVIGFQRPTPAKPAQTKQLKGTEKSKDTKTRTTDMVKQISNHYKDTFSKTTVEQVSPFKVAPINRFPLKRNWYPMSPAQVAASTTGLLTLCNQSENRNVYEFGLDVELSGSKCAKSFEMSGMESRSAKKCRPAKTVGLNVKKHLFSDTDTDNMTEVSWLKSANRRPKPKVADYTRQPAKPSFHSSEVTIESPSLPPPSAKAEKLLHKPKRKRQKKVMELMDKKSLNTDSRKPTSRPQRTAALSKSYRELSDSESQSGTDEPPPAKKLLVKQPEKPKSTASLQTRGQVKNKDKTSYSAVIERTVTENQEKPKKGHVTMNKREEITLASPEGSKRKMKNPPLLESTKRQKEWASKIASFCPSSPSTDRLKSADKKATLPKSPLKTPRPLTKDIGQAEKKDKSFSNGVFKQPEREKRQSEERTIQLETEKKMEEKGSQWLAHPKETLCKKRPDPQESSKEQREPWAPELASFSPSPFSTEKMRSVENSAALPRSPLTPLRPLPISPVGVVSPPMELPSHLKGIQASSFYKTSGGRHSAKFPHHHSVEEAELSPVPIEIQPLITSTGRGTLACSFPLNSPNLKEDLGDFTNSRSLQASFDKESVISLVTLSQSSHRSRNSIAMICTEVEKTPVCVQGSKTGEKNFQSGPGTHRKRPRSCHSISLSETDDSEEEEGGTKIVPRELMIKMKPRRLFKPTDKQQPNKKVKGSKQPMDDQNSSEEEEKENVSPRTRAATIENLEIHSTLLSNVVSSCWETSAEADVDMPTGSTSQEMGIFYHQFSSELKRKFESHARRMDLFTKQSLKSFRQHVSSVSVQTHKYRSQRLEKVKQVLLDEIKNLEQDDTALCNMEKELMTYWKKQALAFHSYQEGGTHRLHHLKSTVETNMFDSLEYEEQIFSSEMCLMKKDMRSVQDRLFKQMQEEELLSVRRGLQALFLPDVSMF